jgi:hypothetical protein
MGDVLVARSKSFGTRNVTERCLGIETIGLTNPMFYPAMFGASSNLLRNAVVVQILSGLRSFDSTLPVSLCDSL